ncbi:hypothetical protein ONS95_004917 [Cadophora gregata]|uniref:uncharacterized protein n=1 Tax=Cadophora gregata TaxID=51156 RepID=UPI0026DAC8C5|nr:uncharacterized protein ONS95_004917 [Cadophora gregata]KAK0104636.1 hypothetical protein ONS95_004917 [Cadophora gregata]
MPQRHNVRESGLSLGKTVLALTLLGLVVVYHASPSSPYKMIPTPSTLVPMPSSMTDRQSNGVVLKQEHSSSGIGRLFVDRLHRRQWTTVIEAEGVIGERVHKTCATSSSDDKSHTIRSQICGKDQIHYVGGRANTKDGSTCEGKYGKRDPLKWAGHRGPPNKYNSYTSKDKSGGSRHSKPVQQTADKSPHTSMNSGIERPKPPADTQSSGNRAVESHHAGNTPGKPSRWPKLPNRSNLNSPVARTPGTRDIRQLGDRKALLDHSEFTSNEKLQRRRSTVSLSSSSKQMEAHRAELVPRRLICNCGVYICTNYRSICKKWKKVPEKQSSVARGSVGTISQVQDKHYIPAYWRINDSPGKTTTLTPIRSVPSEKDIQQVQPDLRKNDNTYNKPAHAPGVTFADVLIPKKCNATTATSQHQCESTHQATIIFYSLLGIFLTSILLLVLLKCYMCFRKRRNVARAKNTKARFYDKSGTSTRPSFAGDSLSSKQEKTRSNGDDINGSRRYINMDGVDDDWPELGYNKWNIFSRKRRSPSRFSPVPQAQAPRIPTLRLPKPVFATVRKVSGLGLDGMLASYKKGLKGNTTDISRVKWTSTV